MKLKLKLNVMSKQKRLESTKDSKNPAEINPEYYMINPAERVTLWL